MDAGRARRARQATLGIWALLVACIAAWPLTEPRIGLIATAIALLPALLPVPGLIGGLRRTLQWSPLALAPALTFAVTELLANPSARLTMTLTLVLILAAFAAVIAALRTGPRN